MAIIPLAHDRRICDRCLELRLQEAMLPSAPRETTLAALRMRALHAPTGEVELDTGRVRRDGPLGLSQGGWHFRADLDDPEMLWGDPPR